MAHASLASGRIENGHGDIDTRHAGPGEPHGENGVEIEPTRPFCLLQNFQGGLNWVETEAEKRILGANAKRLQSREEIPRHAPENALERSIGAEDRNATDKSSGVVF